MKRFQLVGAAALGMVVLAGTASAQGYGGNYVAPSGNSATAPGAVLDSVVSRVTATTTGAVTDARMGEISGGSVFSPLGLASAGTSVGNKGFGSSTGVAGQGAKRRVGIWINGAYSDIDYNEPGLRTDGDTKSVGLGIDYLVTDNIIVGIGATYEDTDLKLQDAFGKFERDGWTVSPYVAFRLGQYFTLTGTVGFSWLNADVSTGAGGTGSFDSDRWYASAMLNFNYPVGQWRLGASVGYLYIDEEDDGYTTSNGTVIAKDTRNIGQGRAGVSVGYNFGGITPYLMGRVEHEFETTDTVFVGTRAVKPDRTGFVVGAGLAFNYGAFSGGLQLTSTEGRENLDVYTISGTVRVTF